MATRDIEAEPQQAPIPWADLTGDRIVAPLLAINALPSTGAAPPAPAGDSPPIIHAIVGPRSLGEALSSTRKKTEDDAQPESLLDDIV